MAKRAVRNLEDFSDTAAEYAEDIRNDDDIDILQKVNAHSKMVRAVVQIHAEQRRTERDMHRIGRQGPDDPNSLVLKKRKKKSSTNNP